MEPDCQTLVVERIRQSGPMTVADFMDLALYAPGAGYYARAAQRSGRAGDFVTSVDVGPLYGELLAVRFADLWRSTTTPGLISDAAACGNHSGSGFQLVEAGAGNGRLSRDILDAAARRDRPFYDAVSLGLVERSARAREAHAATLGPHAAKLALSAAELPSPFTGILFANELLDAFPVHVVEMTDDGLREVYVDAEGPALTTRLGGPSSVRLQQYFDVLGIALHPGVRVEVNLAAIDWIRAAARRLESGFIVLIDYGREARALYEGPHATGTLTTFHRQMADLPDAMRPGAPAWLAEPGTRDLTTHVDFTTLRREAETAGLSCAVPVSQSRYLLDLVERSGLVEDLAREDRLRDRLALKSLLVPGGLGSSHSVIELARKL